MFLSGVCDREDGWERRATGAVSKVRDLQVQQYGLSLLILSPSPQE